MFHFVKINWFGLKHFLLSIKPKAKIVENLNQFQSVFEKEAEGTV